MVALAGALLSIRLISALSLPFSFSRASSRLRIVSAVVSAARTRMVLAGMLNAIVAAPSRTFDLRSIGVPPAVAFAHTAAPLLIVISGVHSLHDVIDLPRHPQPRGPTDDFALAPCCAGNRSDSGTSRLGSGEPNNVVRCRAGRQRPSRFAT